MVFYGIHNIAPASHSQPSLYVGTRLALLQGWFDGLEIAPGKIRDSYHLLCTPSLGLRSLSLSFFLFPAPAPPTGPSTPAPPLTYFFCGIAQPDGLRLGPANSISRWHGSSDVSVTKTCCHSPRNMTRALLHALNTHLLEDRRPPVL